MNETKTGHVIPYFVEMLRYQAWIGMGKIVNPNTQEIDRNLEAARLAIDLLADLDSKTTGNQSESETKLLAGVLTELRLNYVEEQKKPDPATEGSEESTVTEDAAGDEEKNSDD